MAKNYLQEIYYVFCGALIIFVAMEIVWPGIVLAYININWLLIFWLINGIVIISIKNRQEKNE